MQKYRGGEVYSNQTQKGWEVKKEKKEEMEKERLALEVGSHPPLFINN